MDEENQFKKKTVFRWGKVGRLVRRAKHGMNEWIMD